MSVEDEMDLKREQIFQYYDQYQLLLSYRLNSIEIFDFQKKTWNIGPPMLTNRHGLGVGCIGGPLYAIGGHDGWSFLNTVERFDPETCVWSYVASMTNARCTLGVAVLENR